MSQIHTNRPLSPHVGIYRWQISNTLSILHRLTGFGLALGLIPFAAWLWGAAYSPALFAGLVEGFSTVLGKIFLVGWTAAFYYHLGNGIRHLNWDMGKGLELDEMKTSGQLIVVFTIAMTIFTWTLICTGMGA